MAGTTLLFSEVLDRVHKAKTKDQKVNEAIKIQIKEEFGAPSGMLPSPSRKGVKKAKKRKKEG